MRSRLMFGMNGLNSKDRARILGFLMEANSMRGVSRLAGVTIKTKLLMDVGTVCRESQN